MKLPTLNPNHWFVFCSLNDLKQGLVMRTIFKRRYLAHLFESGNVQIFLDYCPHRGYPLSLGKVDSNTFTCKYHGWKFNELGKCTNIPHLDEALPEINCIKLETRVEYGQVWCKIGEAKFFPTLHLMNNPEEFRMSFLCKASALLIMENTFDRFHIPFVHRKFTKNIRKTLNYKVITKTNLIEVLNFSEGKQVGLISRLFGKDGDSSIERYIHPGIIQLEYLRAGEVLMLYTLFLTPSSDNQFNVEVTVQFKKSFPPISKFAIFLFKYLSKKVAKEDIDALETQQFNFDLNDQGFVSSRNDFLFKLLSQILSNDGLLENKMTEIKLNI